MEGRRTLVCSLHKFCKPPKIWCRYHNIGKKKVSDLETLPDSVHFVILWQILGINIYVFIYLFYKDLISFLETGEGREKEEEKHRSVASLMLLIGDLACNPGMCPDWELNQGPFGSQAGGQSTESHQSGLDISIF